MPQPEEPGNQEYKYLLKTAWMGALRAAVALPYQHPLDCIKTVMQAQKQPKGMIEVAKMIYTQSGIFGFYKGYIPNTFRVMYKEFYRFPLMIYLPHLSKGNLKIFNNQKINSSVAKAMSGIGLGLVDVFLVNPLQRLKVWLMTNRKKLKLRVFFTQSNNLIKQLYKGLQPAAFRQISSWVSFLVADQVIKQKLRRLHGIPDTQMLGYYDLLLVSFGVGIFNTLAIMPFDMAKTECQKRGGSQKWTLEIIKQQYKKYGLRKLYTGWDVRIIAYIAWSLLSVTLYDYMETGFRKLKKDKKQ